MFRNFKHTYLILVSLIAVFFISCDNQKKEKAQQVVIQFHQAYKSQDLQEAIKFYPNIMELKGDFYKTDELEIKGVCIFPSNDILVIGENKWTNGFGNTNTKIMKFFVREFEEGGHKEYKIFDSKNFVSFDTSQLYNIAKKTGAIINGVDTTDVTISRKIIAIQPMINDMAERIRSDIQQNVTISNNNWQTGDYYDYASGRSMFVNNSSFPIKNPKARLEFRATKNGNIISTHDTQICYGWLGPGAKQSFTWYANHVGNVHWCRAEVILDNLDETVNEILINFPFQGNEYSTYIANH